MTTLLNAHHEWSKRAPDERFSSVQDLHQAALGYRNAAGMIRKLPVKQLEAVVSDSGEVVINDSVQTKLTNWSFGQLAKAAEAPAGYLQTLPAQLAADCLNNGLRKSDAKTNMFCKLDNPHEPRGMRTLRALLSDRYSRIWNSDITSRLLEIEAQGTFRPAPAAFDGSRGLYLSDRDMFAFMVDNDRRIFETGPDGGLSRGFFIGNSEVGGGSFYVTKFFYEYVCGNHRVWGASQVQEVRIRHVGSANEIAFTELEAELIQYADASASEDELQIAAMRRYSLGKNKEEVLDRIFGLRQPGLGKKLVESSYEKAEEFADWYGDPNTAWGLAGGMTQIARDLPNANDRVALEKASSVVMELAL